LIALNISRLVADDEHDDEYSITRLVKATETQYITCSVLDKNMLYFTRILSITLQIRYNYLYFNTRKIIAIVNLIVSLTE